MDCALCRNRFFESMFDVEPCGLYKQDLCDARDTKCSRYKPETDEDREYFYSKGLWSRKPLGRTWYEY